MIVTVDEDVAESESSADEEEIEEEEVLTEKKPVRKSKETAKTAGRSISNKEKNTSQQMSFSSRRGTNSLVDRSQRTAINNACPAETIR